MDDQSKPPARSDPAAARGTGTRVEDAFDIWLQNRLHQLYDAVTQEPIPPELLRLIEQDRHRRGG